MPIDPPVGVQHIHCRHDVAIALFVDAMFAEDFALQCLQRQLNTQVTGVEALTPQRFQRVIQ
ncbi:hypothetical protein D9M73_252830 [compost metagenome]